MVRHTWADAAQRWILETSHKADHNKDKSKLRWISRYFQSLYLDEITRDVIDVVAMDKRLVAKPSTVNRYLALIRSILRMARDQWEWIPKIPHIRFFSEPHKRVRWLTRDDAAKLLLHLPKHLQAMARFTLATGLRQHNVSYLRWDQIDLQRGMAWIHADQAKSRKNIPVPLNETALAVLNQQVGIHSEWVFTYRGKPVDRASTRAWYLALKRAGITNFRWHDLRHTWASWHAQSGTTLHQLMELGGWSCMDMVLRYAHFTADHLKPASRNVERFIQ